MTPALDLLLFVVLPYVAIAIFTVGTVERYRRHGFSWTSHSTQFLENRAHFWALVPFHAGILTVAVGHLVGAAIPAGVLLWNGNPLRRSMLEGAAFAGGTLALLGFAGVLLRRGLFRAVRLRTRPFDWLVYAVLLVDLTTGVATAAQYPWGTSWFAAAAAPYLRSIVRLQPDATIVAALPAMVRAHVAGAWLLLALFPFSRLVHVLSVPNAYLWRPPQVVRWYGRPAAASARKS